MKRRAQHKWWRGRRRRRCSEKHHVRTFVGSISSHCALSALSYGWRLSRFYSIETIFNKPSFDLFCSSNKLWIVNLVNYHNLPSYVHTHCTHTHALCSTSSELNCCNMRAYLAASLQRVTAKVISLRRYDGNEKEFFNQRKKQKTLRRSTAGWLGACWLCLRLCCSSSRSTRASFLFICWLSKQFLLLLFVCVYSSIDTHLPSWLGAVRCALWAIGEHLHKYIIIRTVYFVPSHHLNAYTSLPFHVHRTSYTYASVLF